MSEEEDAFHLDDFTDEELNDVLAAHQTWLDSDGKEGQRADLSGVVDLMGGRLAGANLAGAIMPTSLKRFRELAHVDQTVTTARPLYLVSLVVCVYMLVTVFSTDDLSLIKNSRIALIPETALGVPISGFFISVPILLFGFYIYFHLYLYRLWQILGGLPSVFHDGTPLDQAVSPWLPTALVRFYQKHGVSRPSLVGFSQKWVTILVVWWAVPATLMMFWARFLVRHDWVGTALHILLVTLAVWSAAVLQILAVAALRQQPRPFRGLSGILSSVTLMVSIGAVFIVLSAGAINGVRGKISIGAPRTWVPHVLNFVGMRSYANLPRASLEKIDLSHRDLRDAVLQHANLRGTNLSYTQLGRADLSEADLQEADLSFANLKNATLWKAKLEQTDFSNANLRGSVLNSASVVNADFRSADLRGAKLNGANLMNVNFSNANLEASDLSDTNLKGAHFRHADLRKADLGLAELDKADLFGADLHGADLLGAILNGVNLSKVKGLEQDQLDQACGENVNGLPARLTIRPCPKEPGSGGS